METFRLPLALLYMYQKLLFVVVCFCLLVYFMTFMVKQPRSGLIGTLSVYAFMGMFFLSF